MVWSWPLIAAPPPLAQKSLASRLKPKVVFSATGGSMRPPPVKRAPAAQDAVPSENEGLGPAGVAGRSHPHANSVATTSPGPNPSLICLNMLRLLSRVVAELLRRGEGKTNAIHRASRAACEIESYAAVAAAQRAAGASIARRQRGARAKPCAPHACRLKSRPRNTGRAPRDAACGPPLRPVGGAALRRRSWRRHGPTELVADPTMISPVVCNVPPRVWPVIGFRMPPTKLCRYTWIMFTVRPLLVTPSPVEICSFSTT